MVTILIFSQLISGVGNMMRPVSGDGPPPIPPNAIVTNTGAPLITNTGDIIVKTP